MRPSNNTIDIIKVTPDIGISDHLDQHNWHIVTENAFEQVVCEMASILSRPQYVNTSDQYIALVVF